MQQMTVKSENNFQTNGKFSDGRLFHEHLKSSKQFDETASISRRCWFTLHRQYVDKTSSQRTIRNKYDF